jgi:hypothetical protein
MHYNSHTLIFGRIFLHKSLFSIFNPEPSEILILNLQVVLMSVDIRQSTHVPVLDIRQFNP